MVVVANFRGHLQSWQSQCRGKAFSVWDIISMCWHLDFLTGTLDWCVCGLPKIFRLSVVSCMLFITKDTDSEKNVTKKNNFDFQF